MGTRIILLAGGDREFWTSSCPHPLFPVSTPFRGRFPIFALFQWPNLYNIFKYFFFFSALGQVNNPAPPPAQPSLPTILRLPALNLSWLPFWDFLPHLVQPLALTKLIAHVYPGNSITPSCRLHSRQKHITEPDWPIDETDITDDNQYIKYWSIIIRMTENDSQSLMNTSVIAIQARKHTWPHRGAVFCDFLSHFVYIYIYICICNGTFRARYIV